MPAWTVWVLRAQLGIVYVYGGLAKLNADWLHGEPMRSWMAEATVLGRPPPECGLEGRGDC